jgi:hypothetical protein
MSIIEHAALAALAVVAALILIWLALAVVWWIDNPGNLTLREATRLLPDVPRLLKRLIYTLMTLLGHESMVTSQRYVTAAGTETRTAAAQNKLYDLSPEDRLAD